MGTSKAPRPDTQIKAGMWSTIADAVQSGWGSTARLLVILLMLGAMLTGAAMATGESELVGLVRTLLDGHQ